MARRRKKLPPRLYTYEQLESLLRLCRKGTRSHVLYGCVAVNRKDPFIQICYSSKKARVVLATVGRGSDGDTVYTVHGVGLRAKTPEEAMAIRKWKQYVTVFTPSDGTRVAKNACQHWRVRDGVATPCVLKPGTWKHSPRGIDVPTEKWAATYAASFPNFTRRCRVFATRLRKALEGGPPSVVSLLQPPWSEQSPLFMSRKGAFLHVCTPPTATQDGRRLLVCVDMHDGESRRHHHVDGDYAVKHSQFLALEDGKRWADLMRWKCSKDAIVGIQEWVLGCIHIPGPG